MPTAPATLKKRRARVAAILPVLRAEHPDARCSLDFTTPLELVVATILSAQCTDARVNLVTPALFARFRTAADYAASPPGEVETFIQSAGFYRQKAKAIRAMAASVVGDFGGEVPGTMAELTTLRGVGRKTANVVLGDAFGRAEGIAVDTHVTRLANRLGLTRHKADAVKIEADLLPAVPQADWTAFSHLLIHHGRRVCVARSPRCGACAVLPHCPTGPKVLAKRP